MFRFVYPILVFFYQSFFVYTIDKSLFCVNMINLGISRLERWTRAQHYGLQPPAEVKEIIEEHINDTKFTQWSVD